MAKPQRKTVVPGNRTGKKNNDGLHLECNYSLLVISNMYWESIQPNQPLQQFWTSNPYKKNRKSHIYENAQFLC